MFSKKYIFETKSTKARRYLKNIFISTIAFYLTYLTGCILIIIISRNENQTATAQFFNNSPDLITVFTGDFGRIPAALNMSKKYPSSNIFITGVYKKNTVETILKKQGIKISSPLIEIDYLARNTVENVISTLKYINRNKVKKILVISNDYHITRIKLIIESLREKNDHYKFYYHGIDTNYKHLRNIIILHKELFKLFRAYGFLLLWENNEIK